MTNVDRCLRELESHAADPASPHHETATWVLRRRREHEGRGRTPTQALHDALDDLRAIQSGLQPC